MEVSTQTTRTSDNVEVAVYDVEDVRSQVGDWDEMTRDERLAALRGVDEEYRFSQHNVTTQSYRNLLADQINPDVSASLSSVTHMAFGNDDTAEDDSDTHLHNEVYRAPIDDHAQRATPSYGATKLLTSDEANGLNLREAALVTQSDPSNSDDLAINRVVLDDPQGRLTPKTSAYAVTVSVDVFYYDG